MSKQDLMDVPGMAEVAAAGEVPPLRPELLASVQAAVAEAIRAERALTPVDELAAARTRRSKRRLVWTAAAAAAVTAGLLAMSLAGGPRTGDMTTALPGKVTATQDIGRVSDAADFLNGVAQVESAQPPSSAPYWKMLIAQTRAGADDLTYTEWLSRTGAYLSVDGTTRRKQFTATWEVGLTSVDWAGLDHLPTSVPRLKTLLLAAGPGRVFDQITQLLGTSPAKPALRAALYQVLAQLPGVRLQGTAKDSTGRTGTAIEFALGNVHPDGEVTARLIIDPKTGLLLEQAEIARTASPADPQCPITPGNPGHCKPAFRVGEVIDSNTYLEAGPAASLS